MPPRYVWPNPHWVAGGYYWCCRIIVCVLGEYLAQQKWDRFIRFGATAAPLEPDLVRVDSDTGRTKVRDYPKPVGSCASAMMVGIPYRDVYDTILMLRDVHPDASTAPTWL